MQLDATADDQLRPRVGNREATGEATDKQPEAKSPRQRHPGGVREYDRPGRPNPFGVQWRVDGKRKTEFFPTEEARNRRAVSLRKEHRSNTLVLVPARDELSDWRAFNTAIGGADWRDVVAAWRSAGGTAAACTVSEVVQRYLLEQDARLAAGKIARVTHKKNCPKARAFAADFSTISVGRVTGAEIEEWIDDLGFEAAETFNTYRKVLHSVFEYCRKECPANPVADVESRNDQGEIEVLTLKETAELFAYAEKNYAELVPRLALEAFAGLRFSSAFRLERGDINFADKGIHLPAHKLKTGRRHYIDGLPANLWKWLALETPATWSMTPRNYRRLKSEVFDRAGVRHPANCLRHSFCTFHVAAFKNPGLTATLLCHRNQSLLWSNYNGRAKQADGIAYFKLAPAGH